MHCRAGAYQLLGANSGVTSCFFIKQPRWDLPVFAHSFMAILRILWFLDNQWDAEYNNTDALVTKSKAELYTLAIGMLLRSQKEVSTAIWDSTGGLGHLITASKYNMSPMGDPAGVAVASKPALDVHSEAIKCFFSIITDASHWLSGCTPWHKFSEPPGEPSASHFPQPATMARAAESQQLNQWVDGLNPHRGTYKKVFENLQPDLSSKPSKSSESWEEMSSFLVTNHP